MALSLSDIVKITCGDKEFVKISDANGVVIWEKKTSTGLHICYAVVDDISTYTGTTDTVYDKATSSWYILNNLGNYEKYGVTETAVTYNQLDYITASDLGTGSTVIGRYLDLGIKFNTQYKFELVAQFASVSGARYMRLFTSNYSYTASTEVTSECQNANNRIEIGVNGTLHNVSLTYTDKNTYTWDKGTFSINDTTAFTDTQSFTTNSNLMLLGCSETKCHEEFVGKLYSFKLYDTDGTTLLRDMIPCQRISDSVYGMYDKVNGKFYSSANSSYPFSSDSATGDTFSDTLTTYEGKLAVFSDNHEYEYTGGTWVDKGAATTTTFHKYYAKYSGSTVKFSSFKSPWNNGYKIVMDANKKAGNSFHIYPTDDGSAPLEMQEYSSNGFYFDWHNPTSTTANTCYTRDYSVRSWGSSSYDSSLNNHQILLSLAYSGVSAVSIEDGSSLYSQSFSRTESMSYCTTGEYNWTVQLGSTGMTVHSIAFYDNNDNLLRNYVFDGTKFVDSITSEEATLTAGTLASEDLSKTVTTYPTSYDELSTPVTSLTFSSLDEANSYTGCCYYGMTCTIGEDSYILNEVNNKPTWEKGTVYTVCSAITGNIYIDTKKTANTNFKFEIDSTRKTGTGFIGGCSKMNLQVESYGKSMQTIYGTVKYTCYKLVMTLNSNTIELDGDDGKYSSNEGLITCGNFYASYENNSVTSTTVDYTEFDDTWKIGSESSSIITSMSYFKLYDGTNLLMDCVPVYKSDTKEYGFANKVDGEFFTNTGWTGTQTSATIAI